MARSRPSPHVGLVSTKPDGLTVTLGDAAREHPVAVVLQLVPETGQQQSIEGRVDETGRGARIALAGLPNGQYRPRLVAWSRSASLAPRSMRLPTLVVIDSS